MQLLNTLLRWFYRVKLRLLLDEADATQTEMDEALELKNYGTYAALAEFHTDLLIEVDNLRRRLAALN